MSMLHFYRNIGGHISKFADGVGNISSKEEFQVTITWGAVQQGIVYEIRQGASPAGSTYDCLAGAKKDSVARFRKTADYALAYANDQQLGANYSLRAALMASQKTVTIEIDTADLATLKGADYKLCFAKKIAEGDYNVVWQSYTKYLVNNVFSWTPQYQLFGTNMFQSGVRVNVATNLVSIGLGEESVLDSAGVLGAPKTGGSDISITLVNNYGSIHPALNQLSTGIDGSQISTPIYVAQKEIVAGNATLTPVEKVLVWFEQNVETSTMFSTARSRSVEIDLTYSNEAVRLYKGQQWITP